MSGSVSSFVLSTTSRRETLACIYAFDPIAASQGKVRPRPAPLQIEARNGKAVLITTPFKVMTWALANWRSRISPTEEWKGPLAPRISGLFCSGIPDDPSPCPRLLPGRGDFAVGSPVGMGSSRLIRAPSPRVAKRSGERVGVRGVPNTLKGVVLITLPPAGLAIFEG